MDSQCVQQLWLVPPGASSVLYYISLWKVMFSQIRTHFACSLCFPYPFSAIILHFSSTSLCVLPEANSN